MTLRLPCESPQIRDEVLSAFLDGTLDLAERLDLETWLAGHPEDQKRLHLLREVIDGLHDLGRMSPDLPAGLTVHAYHIGVPPMTPGPQPNGRWMMEVLLRRRVFPVAIGHTRTGTQRCVARRNYVFLRK